MTPSRRPFGERERMLGGAAVHFALAASFFDEVRVVGPVGEDFGEARARGAAPPRRGRLRHRARRRRQDVLLARASTAGTSTRARRSTPSSACSRASQPKLSERSRSSDVLFLANIQPDLQREVRAQLPDARFVALDSMNLWIDIARDSLVQAIDERRLRDPQRRRAAPADGQAEPRRGRARDPRLERPRRPGAARGPERDRRQAGRVRRRADHRARASSRCPPIRWRR